MMTITGTKAVTPESAGVSQSQPDSARVIQSLNVITLSSQVQVLIEAQRHTDTQKH